MRKLAKDPEIHWVLEKHLCRHCGGRVLRSVKGAGVTPGGNPIYKCASCGISTSSTSPSAVCWCGFSHWSNSSGAYKCLPFKVITDYPDLAFRLTEAFLACGCNPTRGEVGVMLAQDWHKITSDIKE